MAVFGPPRPAKLITSWAPDAVMLGAGAPTDWLTIQATA